MNDMPQKNNTNLSDIINELIELKVESRCSQFGERLGKDLECIESKLADHKSETPEILAKEVRTFFSLTRIFTCIGFFFFSIIAATWLIATVITTATSDIAQHKKDIDGNTKKIDSTVLVLKKNEEFIAKNTIIHNDYKATKELLTNKIDKLENYKTKVDKEYAVEMQRINDQLEQITKHINKQ